MHVVVDQYTPCQSDIGQGSPMYVVVDQYMPWQSDIGQGSPMFVVAQLISRQYASAVQCMS
jgi:hypothetical protein